MPKFKRIGLDLKAETLNKLIFSYLSGYAPTRASVAKSCSVSEMTSGKAARALIDSGFMCERKYSSDGKRPCFHLFCNDGVRVLVIDLSSSVKYPTWTISIFSSRATQRMLKNRDTVFAPFRSFTRISRFHAPP